MSQPTEQPPEQPSLAAVQSFTSTTSNSGNTPNPDHNSLTSPPPRTLSHTLTPSLPAGVPSPLTYTPSIAGNASPAFSVSDSIYSPRPHSASLSSASEPSVAPPLHSQPSQALAQSAHHQLTAALSGVYLLLSSYQRLSSIDTTTLTTASSHRDDSDASDAQLAATIQQQRHDIDTALHTLAATLAILAHRDRAINPPPPVDSSASGDEVRLSGLTARRDHLLALVAAGNADVSALVERLRGLQSTLAMFARDSEVEMRVVAHTGAPAATSAAQQSASSVRR